jgi:hypothetical protein
MIRFSSTRLSYPLLLTALVFAMAGCGSEPTGQVSGKVAYRGKPLSGWDVQMYSREHGVGATGTLNSSGQFRIADSLPAGTYAVYLTPPEPLPPQEGQSGSAAAKPAPTIPPKYADATTSGLSYPVEIGMNDLLIELKD